MKNKRSPQLLLISLFLVFGFTQPIEKVKLKLKNNSLRPREFKFLERHPTDKDPNVFTAFLMPGQSYTAVLKVGTSLALVTQPEINAAMRGQNVSGKPLLVVTGDDNGKTIKLNN